MAKKYSVQLEDDEVVSVEIDGVSYTDPNDIPDLQDRKKIKALMSKTAGGGTQKAFSPKVRREFREMRRNSGMFPRLIVAIFLGVAVMSLIVTAFSTYSAVQTISKEKSAPGRVVDLVVRSYHDSSTGDVTKYTYPVVEFSLPDESLQRIQMSEGSSPPDYAVGDLLTVLYDPQHPANARIQSFLGNLMLWILPGITFFLGAAFLIATAVLFKFWPPNTWDSD